MPQVATGSGSKLLAESFRFLLYHNSATHSTDMHLLTLFTLFSTLSFTKIL